MKYFCLILIFVSLCIGGEFEEFKTSQSKQFENFAGEFEQYQKVYASEFASYSKSIAKNFGKTQLSSQHTWVGYDEKFLAKKSVDFKNAQLHFEVIAKDEKDAKEKISKLMDEISKETTKSAFDGNILEKNVRQKLNIKSGKIDDKPLVFDAFTPEQIEAEKSKLKDANLQKTTFNKNQIFKFNIKMPDDFTIKKAKMYAPSAQKFATQYSLPVELVLAIIHTESSFNPMAKSPAPAYGLMQIVPRSAGSDVAKTLGHNQNVLTPEFLYDGDNNILYGTTYLHLLNTKYFAKISNPKSRLFCIISAYNTGASNVARTFDRTTKIDEVAPKIDAISSDEVYEKLIVSLPFIETREYLYRVNERLEIYKKLIENGQIR